MTEVNLASKEILARLLANENIDVVHDNVQTASFDVKDRVLRLPQWDNMDTFTYDHLVGHEVGHALYTPADGWETALTGEFKTAGFKTFLNVVEDARIEKLIQRRYPGLRRSFVKSYSKMMDDNFFGADVEEINETYELIDRLNVLFKCGESVGIRIEEDEYVWVKELRNLESFEDAVDTAKRLYVFAKAKAEQEAEEQEEQEMTLSAPMPSMDGDASEETESQSGGDSSSDDSSEDEAKGSSASTGAGGDETTEEESSTGELVTSGRDGGNSNGNPTTEPSAQTDTSLNDNIRDILSKLLPKEIYNFKFPKVDSNKYIVTPREVAALFEDKKNDHNNEVYSPYYVSTKKKAQKLLAEFNTNNKKAIAYLVKEFEMKKRAAEYARTSVSKTGVIDPVKMNNYRFTDDIFKKMAVVRDGKNHGLIMYIDWSGSMQDQIYNTVKQCLNIAMFCQKVNIPFRLFAFTDGWREMEDNRQGANTVRLKSTFRLIEWLNSDLKRNQFSMMAGYFLAAGYAMDRYTRWAARPKIPYILGLGGTPMNDAIVAGVQIHKEFQKKYKLDIVNAVWLTDGSSNNLDWNGDNGCEKSLGWSSKINLTIGKKRYVVADRYDQQTADLMNIYREQTGAKTIGFYVISPRHIKHEVRCAIGSMDWEKINVLSTQMRKENFLSVTKEGMDKQFLICGGRDLATSNGEIQVADDASKAQIRNAFKKAGVGKLTSRRMLTEFIETVS